MACQKRLMAEGNAYPRTCEECSLGPCPYYCPSIPDPSDSVKAERERTARHRFYVMGVREKYPFIVCDGEGSPKSIAKFKDEDDADLFLSARRERYVLTGE